MNEELTQRWNSVVGPRDEVYILGDMCWGGIDRSENFIKALNGRKHLIVGNHDRVQNTDRGRNLFASINGSKTFATRVSDRRWTVTLCHFPILLFSAHRREHGLMLYGHVHQTVEFDILMEQRRALMRDSRLESTGNLINVGCMMPYMDYTPQPLSHIIEHGLRFNREWDEAYDVFCDR